LPKYSGNLDIMTAAATRTGEMFAREMLEVPAAASEDRVAKGARR
jgi:acetaldehyde dehydrogenase (acetylating)